MSTVNQDKVLIVTGGMLSAKDLLSVATRRGPRLR